MKQIETQMLHGNLQMLVLLLLGEGACHGYQIRRELASRSRGYFHVAFGRLYPLLRSLAQDGLVRARWAKVGKVRERKMYGITHKGRAELVRRRAKWREFCAAMDLVLSSNHKSSGRTRS